MMQSLRNVATSRQEIYAGEMLYSIHSSLSYDNTSKHSLDAIQDNSLLQDTLPVVYVQGYEGDYRNFFIVLNSILCC